MYICVCVFYVASKVEIRQYVDRAGDSLECEIQRYNTKGIVMRWPGFGAQEHDVWFTCILRHSKSLFHLTTFLRHTPAQEHFQGMINIGDRELLTTSGNYKHPINLKKLVPKRALTMYYLFLLYFKSIPCLPVSTATMVVLTRTPVIKVGLMMEQTLHCQYEVDHKQASVTVEWMVQRRGERTKLFSYSSRTGKSEGSGVSVKTLATGDASLKIPLTKQTSEGTYTCSVFIPPLHFNSDIVLKIQGGTITHNFFLLIEMCAKSLKTPDLHTYICTFLNLLQQNLNYTIVYSIFVCYFCVNAHEIGIGILWV